MTANPFAALLAGVPRMTCNFDTSDGSVIPPITLLHEDAALAAAVPADLAESGKVLDNMHRIANNLAHEGYVNEANAADEGGRTIRSLIALATAQAARIEGLEATVAEVTSDRAYIIGANAGWEAAVEHGEATPAAAAMLAQLEAAEKRPSWDEYNALLSAGYEQKARAEAAETALAAERARVAKLVEAWGLVRSHSRVKVTLGDGDARKSWGAFLIAVDEARAAITEAGQ